MDIGVPIFMDLIEILALKMILLVLWELVIREGYGLWLMLWLTIWVI